MSEQDRLREAAGRLLAWYEENRRELPWREDASPYRVWISEIMLQQTRIEAVLGYFERFLREFPDVRSLAEAEEDRVLKLWEGLGYYSRARNLRKAAIRCCEEYGGELPASYEKLLALPGIGPYTAGAIGSIAYSLPVPAVDGNVLRVLSRLLADPSDIQAERTKRRAQELLVEILPKEEPGTFNQAVMELGERICIPNGAPLCAECPEATCCLAHEQGRETEFPVRGGKKARRVEQLTVLVIRCGPRFAIRKRPESGLLAGLYEFPWLPGHKSRSEVAAWAAGQTDKYDIQELPAARHIFSHVEWEMIGYRITAPREWGEGWFFADAEAIREHYSLPTAWRTYASELKRVN